MTSLFVRSFAAAKILDLGVELDRVLRVSASWPRSTEAWTPERMERDRQRTGRFYEEALAEARRLPSVEHAAIAVGTPFGSRFTVKLRMPDREELPRLPRSRATWSTSAACRRWRWSVTADPATDPAKLPWASTAGSHSRSALQ